MAEAPRYSVLPLRPCQTHSQRGKIIHSLVRCPRDEDSREVGGCTGCASYGGVSFQTNGGRYEASLLCRVVPRPETLATGTTPTVGDRVPAWTLLRGEMIAVRADLPIGRVAALMLEHGIGCLPIVDEERYPLGIVTKTDLLRRHQNDRSDIVTVGDLVSPIAFTLPGDVSISQVAALMAIETIHHIPLVASDGRLIGVVSSFDIVGWLAENDRYLDR